MAVLRNHITGGGFGRQEPHVGGDLPATAAAEAPRDAPVGEPARADSPEGVLCDLDIAADVPPTDRGAGLQVALPGQDPLPAREPDAMFNPARHRRPGR